MKTLVTFLTILLISGSTFAEGEVLFQRSKELPSKIETEVSVKKHSKPKVVEERNLPSFYNSKGPMPVKYTVSINTPKDSRSLSLGGLITGEAIRAEVTHSVIAFPDDAAPVVAKIDAGPLKGALVVGKSILEPNSQTISITFDQISHNGQVYDFYGQGLTTSGRQTFEGEYKSREATYFAADFLSSMTAAYFDGLIPRHQSAFGDQVRDSGPGSAVKAGLRDGALSSADRFRDKLMKVPEFSELIGPFKIQILVLSNKRKKVGG